MTTRIMRRYRFEVAGTIEQLTDDQASEARDYVERMLTQIFEKYGFQLAISGMQILGPFE